MQPVRVPRRGIAVLMVIGVFALCAVAIAALIRGMYWAPGAASLPPPPPIEQLLIAFLYWGAGLLCIAIARRCWFAFEREWNGFEILP